MEAVGVIILFFVSLAIGIGVGIGSGYAIWGRNNTGDSHSGKEDKWMSAVADAPKTIMMDFDAGRSEGNYTYTIDWGEMQSYRYKNLLFDKDYAFDRDPPDWDQTLLISGAARNEAAATLSRAALMNADDVNTAQLPYRFNFTLVRPVFVGDVEVFSATIEYISSSSSSDPDNAEGSPCGDAIVSGIGTVNGTVYTITTISYKCMHGQPDRLSEKGYSLRETGREL